MCIRTNLEQTFINARDTPVDLPQEPINSPLEQTSMPEVAPEESDIATGWLCSGHLLTPVSAGRMLYHQEPKAHFVDLGRERNVV